MGVCIFQFLATTGCQYVMHLKKRPKAAYMLALACDHRHMHDITNAQIVYMMNSMSFKPPCTIIIESHCPHLTRQSPNCCWSGLVLQSLPSCFTKHITQQRRVIPKVTLSSPCLWTSFHSQTSLSVAVKLSIKSGKVDTGLKRSPTGA